jgi:hypothetical protein
LCEEVSADGLKIDAYPLFRIDEMWRSVETRLAWETGSLPKSSEKGLNECTCTPFAFGPCDMNNVKVIDLGSLFSVGKVLTSLKEAYRVTDLVKPLPHSNYARSTLQVGLSIPIRNAA